MTDGAYAGLRLAARAGEPDPETEEDLPEEDEPEAGDKKKEPEMSDTNELETAKAEAHSAGFAAANARFAAVMASEHYAGRETLAQSLLANDKLSADEIITHLEAAQPAGDAGLSEEEQRQAAEEGGRQEMQNALDEGANSNIDANNGGGMEPVSKVDSILAAQRKARGRKTTQE